MADEGLAPGVEDAEDADFCAQVLGIGRDFLQGGSSAGEQEMVKRTRIVLGQEVELVGDGEDEVKVVGREEFAFPGGQPAFARLCLALRAASVATRVIRDGLVSTSWTSIEMTTGRSGTAVPDSSEGFELLEIQARSIALEEALALHAEDVGHLHEGADS